MVEEVLDSGGFLAFFGDQSYEARTDVSDSRTAEDSNELAGGAAIVAHWNDVTQRARIDLPDLIKDIDEAVGCASAREDGDVVSFAIPIGYGTRHVRKIWGAE
ncbi:hypothetical protein KC331_g21212 [Hortaea werneckii]|nr:hypothetical protein KC331_g21212 [Hortaea werneckii]